MEATLQEYTVKELCEDSLIATWMAKVFMAWLVN